MGVPRSDHDRTEHPWSDRFARSWVLFDHTRPSSGMIHHMESRTITWPLLLASKELVKRKKLMENPFWEFKAQVITRKIKKNWGGRDWRTCLYLGRSCASSSARVSNRSTYLQILPQAHHMRQKHACRGGPPLALHSWSSNCFGILTPRFTPTELGV